MAVLSGQSENGWTKSTLKGDVVQYETTLTHTSSTTSNQLTGLFPSEVIKHLYKQFSNVYVYFNWSTGTKNTTVNLLLYDLVSQTGIIQTREVFAAAARAGGNKSAMIVPKNLYSADGAFVDTTNLLSPYMGFQDLAGSGSGTNTVTIQLVYAPEDVSYLKKIGDSI
tara:strand:- start:688 stop:1188 length:501 start_codon:yes stop_codon:yes gene_type:complete